LAAARAELQMPFFFQCKKRRHERKIRAVGSINGAIWTKCYGGKQEEKGKNTNTHTLRNI
jgi:predicted alpha/beta-fold hydrolase